MAKAKVSDKKPSKDEQIGYHKGALATLSKERAEMLRILGIVEQLMQMHIGELQSLGVDLTKEISKTKKQAVKKKPPIEELV